jgi:hypothetical protein
MERFWTKSKSASLIALSNRVEASYNSILRRVFPILRAK